VSRIEIPYCKGQANSFQVCCRGWRHGPAVHHCRRLGLFRCAHPVFAGHASPTARLVSALELRIRKRWASPGHVASSPRCRGAVLFASWGVRVRACGRTVTLSCGWPPLRHLFGLPAVSFNPRLSEVLPWGGYGSGESTSGGPQIDPYRLCGQAGESVSRV